VAVVPVVTAPVVAAVPVEVDVPAATPAPVAPAAARSMDGTARLIKNRTVIMMTNFLHNLISAS